MGRSAQLRADSLRWRASLRALASRTARRWGVGVYPRSGRASPQEERLSRVTVLIADDLKFFLETEKSYLQRGGFEVLTASSGEEAVAVASKRQPHLVLLDLEMPKTDGAAACAAMRKIPALAATPIIIMSATETPQNRERCMKAGCTEFVAKPEKPDELLGIGAHPVHQETRGEADDRGVQRHGHARLEAGDRAGEGSGGEGTPPRDLIGHLG